MHGVVRTGALNRGSGFILFVYMGRQSILRFSAPSTSARVKNVVRQKDRQSPELGGGPELGRPYHSLIIHFVTAVTVLQFSKSLSHTLKYFYIYIYINIYINIELIVDPHRA